VPSSRLIVPPRAQPLWKPPQRQLALDTSHPSARSLVSFFLFNEGAGRIAYDLAATRTATLDAAATWSMGLAGPSPRVNGGNTSTQLGTFSTSIVTTGSSWSVELMFLHSASQGVMGSCILSNGTNYGVTYETTGTKLSVDGTGNTAETTALTAGVWAHEVLTWDGTTSTFFRNGLPNGSGTGAGATAPATFDSWLGASTALNQTPSSIAWLRVWSRIVGQAEALDLFANPFAMVIVPAEDARTFAVLSGRRALVAPFPNLAMLFSPPPSSGVAITGTAFGTGAATALTISHAGTLEADGTGAATALTISHAGTFEADGSAALMTLSLTVTKALTLESDGTGTATTLSLTVTKALTLESDGTGVGTTLSLTVTKAIAGETDGVGTATTLTLTVTKAIAGTTSGTGVGVALTLTIGAGGVSISGQSNGTGVATALTLTVAVAITGQASGSGAGVALALTVSVAIVGTANGSGAATALTITAVVTGPTRITVSDAPLWATALSDAPVWATALSDAPLAATGLGDAATSATSVADAALAQTVLVDA